MNENEYLHNTRDVFDRFRLRLHQKYIHKDKDKSDMRSWASPGLWGSPACADKCRLDQRVSASADATELSPYPPWCPATAVT